MSGTRAGAFLLLATVSVSKFRLRCFLQRKVGCRHACRQEGKHTIQSYKNMLESPSIRTRKYDISKSTLHAFARHRVCMQISTAVLLQESQLGLRAGKCENIIHSTYIFDISRRICIDEKPISGQCYKHM